MFLSRHFLCTRIIWKVSPSACFPEQRGRNTLPHRDFREFATLGVAMNAPISSLHKQKVSETIGSLHIVTDVCICAWGKCNPHNF